LGLLTAKLAKNYFLRNFAPLMNPQDSLPIPPSDSILPIWHRMNFFHDFKPETGDSLPVDSIGSNAIAPPPRFFTGHSVHPNGVEPIPRSQADSDWLYGSFALILFLIVLLRIAWPLQLKALFGAITFRFRSQPENRIFEFKPDLFSIIFMMIYSAIYSLLLMALLQGFNWLPLLHPGEAVQLFFALAFALLLLLIFKIALIAFTSRVFGLTIAGVFYQDHLLASGFISAAFMLPLVVINSFSASMVFVIMALIISIVLTVVRVFRMAGVRVATDSFSYLHFILYFCTLEILPLLIIGKILVIVLMG
jgi:hypothetical protein